MTMPLTAPCVPDCRDSIAQMVDDAIEQAFKTSALYAALRSESDAEDAIGARQVFNNIAWWSEPIDIDGKQPPPLP